MGLGKNVNVLEFGAGWGFWAKHALENGINIDVFEKTFTNDFSQYVKYNVARAVELITAITEFMIHNNIEIP